MAVHIKDVAFIENPLSFSLKKQNNANFYDGDGQFFGSDA